jgi:type 2 lantibiotic biosynthesis protein LanM
MDIENLLRRAAPLAAEAAVSSIRPGQPQDMEAVAGRIERWRERAARNDDERFVSRLAWDGLTPESAIWAVSGERSLRPEDEWWASTTRRLLLHLLKRHPPEPTAASFIESDSQTFPNASIPFSPILTPLVSFAATEIARSRDWASCSGAVHKQLLNALCLRLSDVSHRALGQEYRRFRDSRPERAGCWSGFLEQMRSGGLLKLLDRLPALTRLLAIIIHFWLEETSEFLGRLKGDWAEIVRFLGNDPGEVVEIECGLSDPHRGGRSVRIVRFVSGARLVYKPRSLDKDYAWGQWMEWVHRCEPRFDLRAPRVLEHGRYGWVEFMAYEPCEDLAAVSRYYLRAGSLLCLLYATASNDFHHENLLACGEHPVPVDLETIFAAQPRMVDGGADAMLSYRESVLSIGLLPRWEDINGQNDAMDLSGFSFSPHTQPELTTYCWIHSNSDEMEFVEVVPDQGASHNMPYLSKGDCPDPGEFVEQIVEGFGAAYDILVAQREALLGAGGPLEVFRCCRSRVVMRRTKLYAQLWERSVNTAFLSAGVDRSIEFEGLSRHYLTSGEHHGTRAMFHSEVASLEQLDIPFFESVVDSGEVLDPYGQKLDTSWLIQSSGFERVLRRIGGFSQSDRDLQIELIRASFAARTLGPLERQDNDTPAPASRPPQDTPPSSPDAWLASTREMAGRLMRKAIWNDGIACWIGFELLPVSRRVCVQILGSSLYSGSPGLAVFFAARYAVEGGTEDRRAALGIMQSMRRAFLSSPDDEPIDPQAARAWLLEDGIGAAYGGGSTIYAMLTTGRLLQDPEPIEIALRLSDLIDEQAILSDRHLDIIGGAAGAILALLVLWKETQAPGLIEKALLCGEHLLRSRVSHEGTPRAWRTIVQRPLAGFSHGAAGIGLALLRLHQAVPDVRFLDAALESFAYERTLFSQEACGWADLRFDSGALPDFGGWCNGAPGIALSRLAALEVIEDPLLRSDLDAALGFLIESEVKSNPALCCGEMGKADILLEAGRRLSRPGLIALARKRASAVAGLDPSYMPIPGLFHGVTGIGYGLLRQAVPDRLPSILLWE